MPGRDVVAGMAPAREQPVTKSQTALLQPRGERLAGRFGQLEGNRPTGLLLDDGGAQSHAVAQVDVGNAQPDEVAAAQLAVDRDVEHGEVADATIVLEAGANGPDVLGFERRLRPTIRPWFHDTRVLN